jgi:hypothetical protein
MRFCKRATIGAAIMLAIGLGASQSVQAQVAYGVYPTDSWGYTSRWYGNDGAFERWYGARPATYAWPNPAWYGSGWYSTALPRRGYGTSYGLGYRDLYDDGLYDQGYFDGYGLSYPYSAGWYGWGW